MRGFGFGLDLYAVGELQNERGAGHHGPRVAFDKQHGELHEVGLTRMFGRLLPFHHARGFGIEDQCLQLWISRRSVLGCWGSGMVTRNLSNNQRETKPARSIEGPARSYCANRGARSDGTR